MNKKYELVIFDLDGTIADTSQGIYNAHQYTMSEIGIGIAENSLNNVIGEELFELYKTRFGLNDVIARKAVNIYRSWYQEQGIFQAEVYSGIPDMLEKLKNVDIKLAVATLKREDLAKQMLKNMKVDKFFDFIYGMDANDTLNKEMLLRKCVSASEVSIREAVLVGDSMNDAKGARACKMDFIGITYGFGFNTQNDVEKVGAVFCADNERELCHFLIK